MATTIAKSVDALGWTDKQWTQAYDWHNTPHLDIPQDWFRGQEAKDIIARLYLRKDETIDGMFRRVAMAVSINHDHGIRVYRGLCRGDFCFSTPIMMNAHFGGTFHSAACFILPIQDSLDSIMETAKVMSQIYRRGGGVGINLSPLRAEGCKTSSGGKAGGPVNFLHMFQGVGKAMYSGGKARKAAFLGALDIEHPDSDKFIKAKDKTGKLNEMNLSIRMDGSKMNQMCWRDLVQNAWECGEPGVIFTDNQDRASKVINLGTCGNNPCTEFVFPPGDHGAACNLGSINLINFANDEKKLPDAVRTLFAALDYVIDVSEYPTQLIQQVMENLRPVGLGFTGLARALMQLKFRYGSQESIEYTKVIVDTIQKTCEDTSKTLRLDHPKTRYFMGREVCEYMVRPNTRNAVMTTVAPTGTISWVMGAEGSFGIEPVFALKSKKKFTTGDCREVDVLIPEYEEWSKSDAGLIFHDEPLPPWFVTANELTVDEHLNMVAAVQGIIDMSVSKTVNLPNSATVKDVEDVFRKAHKLGLKGITVYRDGCKDEQVMTLAGSSNPLPPPEVKDTAAGAAEIQVNSPVPATKIPACQQGTVHRLHVEGSALYVHVYKNEEGKIQQVFLTYDKPGESTSAFTSALGRIISIGLQRGVPIEAIVSTLKGIYSSAGGGFHHFPGREKGTSLKSVPDAIASVLAFEAGIDSKNGVKSRSNGLKDRNCPECGEKVTHQDGCEHCTSCNWTKGCG